ncbi:MAG: PIG-L family deacetylase [Candidatus Saccharimonadales bacterium]
MIRSKQDIKKLGTIMGIWAHPDDEVMSTCGILCAAIANGQTAVCVTATRGEAGLQDETRWPAGQLGVIRSAELKAAYKLIGLKHHHHLDYPDGGCHNIDDNAAVQRLLLLIETYQPDSIMTFGPDGITGHTDHQTVSRWVSLANKRASKPAKLYHAILTDTQYEAINEADKAFDLFFNTDKPKTIDAGSCDILLELDAPQLACKLACLQAMPSQYEAVLEAFGEALKTGLATEAFVHA